MRRKILDNITYRKYNEFYKNILPNNIHFVLCYIRRINNSVSVFDRIIKKLSQKASLYSKMKFHSHQTFIKEKLTNLRFNEMFKSTISHIDPSPSIFTIEKHLFYNKVTQIFIYSFFEAWSAC